MLKHVTSRWTVPALALTVVGTLAAVHGQSALSAPPPQEVTVVNRTSNAVPVRLAASRTVVFTRDVDQPARSPFQTKVRIDLPAGQCCENGFVDVPAGKRLVIEYASALGLAPAGQTFNFE